MSVNVVEKVDDRVPVRHALISVSDKEGLETLVEGLLETVPEVKIFSTGGTFARIREILGRRAEGTLVQVSDYTGQPETQGGLVKTLDFKIYLGLLTETYNNSHQEDLKRTGAVPIDLVVVNLYPFRKTIETPDVTVEQARANVDIGGPCMVRASAKNYLRVAVIVDPSDYESLVGSLRDHAGSTGLAQRFRLAAKAFQHTAAYDQDIQAYLNSASIEQVTGCYQKQPKA